MNLWDKFSNLFKSNKTTRLSSYNYDLFWNACETGDLEYIKKVIHDNPNIDISKEDRTFIRTACAAGHLHIVQHLLLVQPNIDISANNEELFFVTCYFGHLHILQYLLQIKPDINISMRNNYVFRIACEKGHLRVVEYLYRINPTIDISAYDEAAFKVACANYHLDIALWFVNLNPNKYTLVSNSENKNIISYKINKILNKHKEPLYIDKQEIDTCSICKEQQCNIQTYCNHTFCESCLTSWIKKNKTCPYCRSLLENKEYYIINAI